ncbi:hypothetical protein CERSUDRAFT_86615, partial [Gelatoporia subvermispora B]
MTSSMEKGCGNAMLLSDRTSMILEAVSSQSLDDTCSSMSAIWVPADFASGGCVVTKIDWIYAARLILPALELLVDGKLRAKTV